MRRGGGGGGGGGGGRRCATARWACCVFPCYSATVVTNSGMMRVRVRVMVTDVTTITTTDMSSNWLLMGIHLVSTLPQHSRINFLFLCERSSKHGSLSQSPTDFYCQRNISTNRLRRTSRFSINCHVFLLHCSALHYFLLLWLLQHLV